MSEPHTSDWEVEPGTVAYVAEFRTYQGAYEVLKFKATLIGGRLYWVFHHKSFQHWKRCGGFFATKDEAEQALRGAVDAELYRGKHAPAWNMQEIPTLASIVLPALQNL